MLINIKDSIIKAVTKEILNMADSVSDNVSDDLELNFVHSAKKIWNTLTIEQREKIISKTIEDLIRGDISSGVFMEDDMSDSIAGSFEKIIKDYYKKNN